MKDCLHPVIAWICGYRPARDGVLSPHMVFSRLEASLYYLEQFPSCELHDLLEKNRMNVPCGKCAACALRKRKDMSVRLAHEASTHERSCFLTLTYDEKSVPTIMGDKTLAPSDVQKFIKRLRRYLEYLPKKEKNRIGRDHVGHSLRYFAVGEYGSKTHRPHYHILIFGWSPSDKEFWKRKGRIDTFLSKQVQKLWPFGFSSVQDVSPYVAKYCARYVTKKLVHPWTPSKNQVPEFFLQSVKNGGIGAPWFDKYGIDACRRRFCTYRVGDSICKAAVPAYYYSRLRHRNIPVWIECRDEKVLWLQSHPQKVDLDAIRRKVQKDIYDEMKRKENEVL